MPLKFDCVHIYEFNRELGTGGIPHTGGFPLGIGFELEKQETLSFEDFDTPIRTKRRRRHPSRQEANRLPSIQERGRKVLGGGESF